MNSVSWYFPNYQYGYLPLSTATLVSYAILIKLFNKKEIMRNIYEPSSTPPSPYEKDLEQLIQDFTQTAQQTRKSFDLSPYLGSWLEGNPGPNSTYFRQVAHQFADKYDIKGEYVNQWIDDIFEVGRRGSIDDVIKVIKKAKLHFNPS